MGVYWGTKRVGEIEDWGLEVLAFISRGDKRVQIGIYADRKSAMAAVAEYDKKGAQ